MAIATTSKANFDASSASMTFNSATISAADADSTYGTGDASTVGIAYKTWTDRLACGFGFRGIGYGIGGAITLSGIANGANSTANFYGFSLNGSSGASIDVSVFPYATSTFTVDTIINGSTVDTRTFTSVSTLQTYTLSVGDLGSVLSGLATIDVKITNNSGGSRSFDASVGGDGFSGYNRAGPINAAYPAYKVVMLDASNWDASDCLGALYRSGSATTSGTGTTYAGWINIADETATEAAIGMARPANYLLAAWDETTGTHYFDVEELCTKWTS
jgi:hypothetical protein